MSDYCVSVIPAEFFVIVCKLLPFMRLATNIGLPAGSTFRFEPVKAPRGSYRFSSFCSRITAAISNAMSRNKSDLFGGMFSA